jgi:hypothetical protein
VQEQQPQPAAVVEVVEVVEAGVAAVRGAAPPLTAAQ